MAFPPKKPAVSLTIMSGKRMPAVPDPDAPEPDPDDTQAGAASDNDADDADWSSALHYHPEAEVCQSCSYMPDDPAAPCPMVKHPVDAGGHCEMFIEKSDAGSDQGAAPEQQEQPQ